MGSLPQDIPQQMPNLRVMFAENNQFSGTIPENLGSLDLRNLHLDDNKFSGTIPDSLPNNLRDATFHYNSLEGDVSQEICENMYQGVLQSISVDCETVSCECCICGEFGV